MGCIPHDHVLSKHQQSVDITHQMDSLNPPLQSVLASLTCHKQCGGTVLTVHPYTAELVCLVCQEKDGQGLPIQLCTHNFSKDLEQSWKRGGPEMLISRVKQKFDEMRKKIKQAEETCLLLLSDDLSGHLKEIDQLITKGIGLKKIAISSPTPENIKNLALNQEILKSMCNMEWHESLEYTLEAKMDNLQPALQMMREAVSMVNHEIGNLNKPPGKEHVVNIFTAGIDQSRYVFDQQILSLEHYEDNLFVGGVDYLAILHLPSRKVSVINRQYCPTAMATRSGRLYFMDHQTKQCYQLSQDFTKVTLLKGRLLYHQNCFSLCVDSQAAIFYADYDGHAVCRLDSTGTVITEYGGKGEGILDGQLNFPFSVVKIGAWLYVSDRGNNRIVSIRDKQIYTVFSMIDGQITQYPCAMSSLDNEYIFVGEEKGGKRMMRVKVLDGQFLGGSVMKNSGKVGLIVGSLTSLRVVKVGNDRIMIWNKRGQRYLIRHRI